MFVPDFAKIADFSKVLRITLIQLESSDLGFLAFTSVDTLCRLVYFNPGNTIGAKIGCKNEKCHRCLKCQYQNVTIKIDMSKMSISYVAKSCIRSFHGLILIHVRSFCFESNHVGWVGS